MVVVGGGGGSPHTSMPDGQSSPASEELIAGLPNVTL